MGITFGYYFQTEKLKIVGLEDLGDPVIIGFIFVFGLASVLGCIASGFQWNSFCCLKNSTHHEEKSAMEDPTKIKADFINEGTLLTLHLLIFCFLRKTM